MSTLVSRLSDMALYFYNTTIFLTSMLLIPLDVIAFIVLIVINEHSSLAVWLTVDAMLTFGVCLISWIVLLFSEVKEPERDSLSAKIVISVLLPFLMFIIKGVLLCWGINETSKYPSKDPQHAIYGFSVFSIIFQLVVYVGSIMLMIRRPAMPWVQSLVSKCKCWR